MLFVEEGKVSFLLHIPTFLSTSHLSCDLFLPSVLSQARPWEELALGDVAGGTNTVFKQKYPGQFLG